MKAVSIVCSRDLAGSLQEVDGARGGDLEEKRQRSTRITVQVAKELRVCMCGFDLLFSFSKSSTH